MMEKQTFKERIRKADSTVKEAKDFFLMQTSFYFSGLSHLINQKYPEWVYEKIMEEYENSFDCYLLVLIVTAGSLAIENQDEVSYKALYQTLIEPLYLMYEKEQEEKNYANRI